MGRAIMQSKDAKTSLIQQIYLICCIVVDIVGVVGVLREYTWIVTAFVLAEGAALGFSTMGLLIFNDISYSYSHWPPYDSNVISFHFLPFSHSITKFTNQNRFSQGLCHTHVDKRLPSLRLI